MRYVFDENQACMEDMKRMSKEKEGVIDRIKAKDEALGMMKNRMYCSSLKVIDRLCKDKVQNLYQALAKEFMAHVRRQRYNVKVV